MSAPIHEADAAPVKPRPEQYPDTPEGAALALLYLIIEQDRSLTSRTSNQPVAAYILDLCAECLRAANGDRGDPRGAGVRDTVN